MEAKKWIKAVATTLVLGFIALFVEVVSLNGAVILKMMNTEYPKNNVYTIEDFEKQNWDLKEGTWFTGRDPMLIKTDLNYEIDEIYIEVSMKPQSPYVQVFYANSAHPYWDVDASALAEVTELSATIPIHNFVQDLRIDLGDDINCSLESLKITVNPTKLTFSFPILVAVVLIYLSGSFLFSLHRPPDYSVLTEIEPQEDV